MKTLRLDYPKWVKLNHVPELMAWATPLLLLWCLLPVMLHRADPTAALPDAGIWQLLLFALICFGSILTGTWWIVFHFWHRLGLVTLNTMVLQFSTLTLWQQLGFYWASFALLLLTAVACIAAIF